VQYLRSKNLFGDEATDTTTNINISEENEEESEQCVEYMGCTTTATNCA